jgi:hypothetical protein
MEATFKVHKTFRLPSRALFVFAGEIIEGTIKAGMNMQIPMNGSFAIDVLINEVSFVHTDGVGLVALTTVLDDPQDADIYEQFDVSGEILNVSGGA